ncbi:MAG: carboxypeptidase regulatory-like domain-containing protein [Acidobacteriaceae bacterium]
MTRFSLRCSRIFPIALAILCLGGQLLAQASSSVVPGSTASYAENALPAAPQPQNTSAAGSQQSTPPATPQSQNNTAEQQLQQEEHQHILGIIPNFNTTDIQNAAPLSRKQKFRLMARSVVDPFEFVAAGAVSGYGQATDNHAAYGQGAEGYAKRYGASYADSADGALWGNAIFPSLFHQDPRYFRRGTGPFWSRFKYSVSTAVWSKNDNGTWGPNYSNVLGNIVSGGISNVYYPSADRGVGLTFEGAAIVTLEGVAGSLGVEFWPDVSHKLFHTPLPTHAEPAPK